MYNVAVTGASGKSGQYFLKRLLSEKEHVKDFKFFLICRKQGEYSKNTEGYQIIQRVLGETELQVELAENDLQDKAELKLFFKEHHIDMLLHIASVKLSPYVVPAAIRGGVNNFILVHTTGIYSKYKAAGEEYRQIEARIQKLAEEAKVEI